MRDYFDDIAQQAFALLGKDEFGLAYLSGEDSDFCRFNHGRIRQAGHVRQAELQLSVIRDGRLLGSSISLSEDPERDRQSVRQLLRQIQDDVAEVPVDPYLLVNQEPDDSSQLRPNRLPPAQEIAVAVLDQAHKLDFVGLLAQGAMFRGFANSLGQRNWFENHSFNLDWSLYLRDDKAVKQSYAGFDWDPDQLQDTLDSGRRQLQQLEQPAITIAPGKYRVYLAPAALFELMDLLGWGAFGIKEIRTSESPLLKLARGERQLAAGVTISENFSMDTAPRFDELGFVRPERVPLVDQGCHAGALVSPRSAREFDLPTTGASTHESPEALDMEGGDLEADGVLERVDDGLYLNNLHYLNYSDRKNCRVTGMTRFAGFRVENGRLGAPINVMRFDESVYRALGDHLEGLTRERELIFDPGSYGRRQASALRLPGALVRDFHFSL